MSLTQNQPFIPPTKYLLDIELMDAVATTHLKPVYLADENEYFLMHLGYCAGYSEPVINQKYHNHPSPYGLRSPVNKVVILPM